MTSFIIIIIIIIIIIMIIYDDVQVTRADDTCECIGLCGLYPAGEGAGYAGGIVSAAVDGTRVAQSMLAHALSADNHRAA